MASIHVDELDPATVVGLTELESIEVAGIGLVPSVNVAELRKARQERDPETTLERELGLEGWTEAEKRLAWGDR